MQLNSTEISELIKQRIAQFNVVSEAHNEGTIVSVSDGIIRIHGLAEVMQGEMIALPGNRFAIALNLERDSVGAVVMGPYADLAEGMKVKCTGRILEVPVGRGGYFHFFGYVPRADEHIQIFILAAVAVRIIIPEVQGGQGAVCLPFVRQY